MIHGYKENTFKPYEDVTRAQLALILARAYEQITGSAFVPKQPANFPDISGYDEETQNAIAMLAELGIAEGDHGKFKPGNTATRAHAQRCW